MLESDAWVAMTNPEISCICEIVTQPIDFTRKFLEAPHIRDDGQLKKIFRGIKRQARARRVHELSGLNQHVTAQIAAEMRQIKAKNVILHV